MLSINNDIRNDKNGIRFCFGNGIYCPVVDEVQLCGESNDQTYGKNLTALSKFKKL